MSQGAIEFYNDCRRLFTCRPSALVDVPDIVRIHDFRRLANHQNVEPLGTPMFQAP